MEQEYPQNLGIICCNLLHISSKTATSQLIANPKKKRCANFVQVLPNFPCVSVCVCIAKSIGRGPVQHGSVPALTPARAPVRTVDVKSWLWV